MPHFAYVEDGYVRKIERIESAVMTDDDGVEQEALGQAFLASLYPGTQPSDFVLTHYPVGQPDPYPRGMYAVLSCSWDGVQFIPPADAEAV